MSIADLNGIRDVYARAQELFVSRGLGHRFRLFKEAVGDFATQDVHCTCIRLFHLCSAEVPEVLSMLNRYLPDDCAFIVQYDPERGVSTAALSPALEAHHRTCSNNHGSDSEEDERENVLMSEITRLLSPDQFLEFRHLIIAFSDQDIESLAFVIYSVYLLMNHPECLSCLTSYLTDNWKTFVVESFSIPTLEDFTRQYGVPETENIEQAMEAVIDRGEATAHLSPEVRAWREDVIHQIHERYSDIFTKSQKIFTKTRSIVHTRMRRAQQEEPRGQTGRGGRGASRKGPSSSEGWPQGSPQSRNLVAALRDALELPGAGTEFHSLSKVIEHTDRYFDRLLGARTLPDHAVLNIRIPCHRPLIKNVCENLVCSVHVPVLNDLRTRERLRRGELYYVFQETAIVPSIFTGLQDSLSDLEMGEPLVLTPETADVFFERRSKYISGVRRLLAPFSALSPEQQFLLIVPRYNGKLCFIENLLYCQLKHRLRLVFELASVGDINGAAALSSFWQYIGKEYMRANATINYPVRILADDCYLVYTQLLTAAHVSSLYGVTGTATARPRYGHIQRALAQRLNDDVFTLHACHTRARTLDLRDVYEIFLFFNQSESVEKARPFQYVDEIEPALELRSLTHGADYERQQLTYFEQRLNRPTFEERQRIARLVEVEAESSYRFRHPARASRPGSALNKFYYGLFPMGAEGGRHGAKFIDVGHLMEDNRRTLQTLDDIASLEEELIKFDVFLYNLKLIEQRLQVFCAKYCPHLLQAECRRGLDEDDAADEAAAIGDDLMFERISKRDAILDLPMTPSKAAPTQSPAPSQGLFVTTAEPSLKHEPVHQRPQLSPLMLDANNGVDQEDPPSPILTTHKDFPRTPAAITFAVDSPLILRERPYGGPEEHNIYSLLSNSTIATTSRNRPSAVDILQHFRKDQQLGETACLDLPQVSLDLIRSIITPEYYETFVTDPKTATPFILKRLRVLLRDLQRHRNASQAPVIAQRFRACSLRNLDHLSARQAEADKRLFVLRAVLTDLETRRDRSYEISDYFSDKGFFDTLGFFHDDPLTVADDSGAETRFEVPNRDLVAFITNAFRVPSSPGAIPFWGDDDDCPHASFRAKREVSPEQLRLLLYEQGAPGCTSTCIAHGAPIPESTSSTVTALLLRVQRALESGAGQQRARQPVLGAGSHRCYFLPHACFNIRHYASQAVAFLRPALAAAGPADDSLSSETNEAFFQAVCQPLLDASPEVNESQSLRLIDANLYMLYRIAHTLISRLTIARQLCESIEPGISSANLQEEVLRKFRLAPPLSSDTARNAYEYAHLISELTAYPSVLSSTPSSSSVGAGAQSPELAYCLSTHFSEETIEAARASKTELYWLLVQWYILNDKVPQDVLEFDLSALLGSSIAVVFNLRALIRNLRRVYQDVGGSYLTIHRYHMGVSTSMGSDGSPYLLGGFLLYAQGPLGTNFFAGDGSRLLYAPTFRELAARRGTVFLSFEVVAGCICFTELFDSQL
ncbi:hypothetical protein GMRT_10160 [Giardia muris]|uniref:Uncharacterized protein n=1 Tax=Giardia muris TaxID=5742 RepID=A0A4Z1T2X4_GIAMU|nr:hypothetical protein GMRT_10160 [Giardia muris]|eukprot:TNJ26771.1 hypothetical protein GMRT_10160 [Giardia muris]